jgi:hypothetical protein
MTESKRDGHHTEGGLTPQSIATAGTEKQGKMSKHGRQGRSKKGNSGRNRGKTSQVVAPPAETLVGVSVEAAPSDLESALAAEAVLRDTDPSPAPEEQVATRPTLADSPSAVAAAMPVDEEPLEEQAAAPPLPEVREEEVSVPPAGDLEAGGFFDSQPFLAEPEIEVDTRDPRLAMKMTAHAARRRAHLAKYVLATVGLMSMLLVAALVKGSVEGKQNAEQARRPVAAAQAVATIAPPPAEVAPAPLANVDTAKAVDPQPTPTSVPAAAAAAEDKPAADVPAPPADTTPTPTPADTTPPPADTTVAAAVAAADTTTDTAAEAPAPDPKAAAKEKAASRTALEWGKVKASIEAGERSVALDPTDGEAWLILGAAYQQKGDAKEARRCFKACMDQGKRGPKGECSAMLR